jgi:alpha-beta hydrolase superfamily lysophospholipase
LEVGENSLGSKLHNLGMRSSFFTLQGADMERLNGRRWQPEGASSAVVVLVHGLGEHMGRYEQLGTFLTSRGISLWGHDLKGHGKSQGTRGHAAYNGLLENVDALLQRVAQEEDGPVFLYGHSMGGNIALNYVLEYPEIAQHMQGLILSSPWLRLQLKPPVWALGLSQVVNLVYPEYTRENGLDPSWLSKDPQICAAYRADPLVHRRISVGLYLAVRKKGKTALKNAAKVNLPTLVMHGSDDPITSFKAGREVAAKIPEAKWKPWPGSRHEPHNDLEKKEVMAFVANWIEEQLKVAV